MDFAEARLHACCSSLGFFDEAEGVYTKEPDCELSVKELIRTLKREDDTRQVRRKVGFLKVFENDLISIICTYPDDTDLFDAVIRLMQNLSSPAILCFGNMPTEALFRSYYMELERYLRSYKSAFVNETLIYNIGMRIKHILESDDSEDEENQLLIERILILFRNVLHIDSNPNDENRTDDDASVHDQVIWTMKKTGVEAVLKYLAINEDQSKWCMHVLEILFHMLRDQSPELLASTPSVQISDLNEWQKSQKEAEIEAKELCALLLKEKEQRKCRATVSSTRHSRFGGSYYVQNLKALNPSNKLIFHGSQTKANYISFDDLKTGKRKPKRLLPVGDRGVPRRSTKVIRQFLKEFVNELLEHAFNNLMHAASDAIRREKIQYNDESYFLWSMGFFLEFNRCYKFRPELISEVLSSQIFNFIHLKMGEYYEMMLQEKKTKFVAISWAERMHLALKTFGELLKSCEKMGNHKEKEIVRSADILKRNLFYNSEYRDLFISFMQRFDQTKMSKSYLKDLVETNHVFLKMLEDFTSKKKLIVKKKGGKKKKKKPDQRNALPTKSGAKSGKNVVSNEEAKERKRQAELEKKESLWDNIAPSLCGIFQGRITPAEQTMMPFDPLSDISLDEQKQIAVARIQRLLQSVDKVESSDDSEKPETECIQTVTAGKIIELLRECRKVWVEGDIFGAVDASMEDEFEILRSIHFADKIDISSFKSSLGQFKDFEDESRIPDFEDNVKKLTELDGVSEGEDENTRVDNNEALHEELLDGGLLSDTSSEDDEMQKLDANEAYFDFNSHLQQYAKHDVVRCYSYLLQFFRTNFSQTNKSVLKMLHRIACDLSMPGLLFQASLFTTLRDILREASIRTLKHKLALDPVMKELVTFGKYLIKQFVRAAQYNKNIYMELIFWKDTSVACEIIDGYGTYVNHGRSDNFRMVFTEENNEELRRLFKEYQESEQNEAQGGVVEYIMANFSRELNKPKVVANQLKSLELVEDLNDLRMVSGRENLGVWRPEHETELRFLWEQFCESEDPLSEIYSAMVHKKPKVRIIQKLLSMGLAQSKNEIIKPDIWPETVIEELKTLFETHKGSPDLLREILDKLSTPKSRKQIANKLVDLKLVESIAELRTQKSSGSGATGPRKSGKQAKIWDEEEIMELQELYGKYRKLKLILEHKTFEASRKEVIEKMKELNLDYKASGVGSKKKGKGLNFLEANDLLEQDDFDIEEQLVKQGSAKKKPKSGNFRSKSKHELVEQALPNGDLSAKSKAQVSSLTKCILRKDGGYYKDSLTWLINSLKSSAEVKKDLENDSDPDEDDNSGMVSFPLVPNGDVVEKALVDCGNEFNRILKLLGMCQPTSMGDEGTEIFWRVPHYLSSEALTKKIDVLQHALQRSSNDDSEDGTEKNDGNENESDEDQISAESIGKTKLNSQNQDEEYSEASDDDGSDDGGDDDDKRGYRSSEDEEKIAQKRKEQLEALKRKAEERRKKEMKSQSISQENNSKEGHSQDAGSPEDDFQNDKTENNVDDNVDENAKITIESSDDNDEDPIKNLTIDERKSESDSDDEPVANLKSQKKNKIKKVPSSSKSSARKRRKIEPEANSGGDASSESDVESFETKENASKKPYNHFKSGGRSRLQRIDFSDSDSDNNVNNVKRNENEESSEDENGNRESDRKKFKKPDRGALDSDSPEEVDDALATNEINSIRDVTNVSDFASEESVSRKRKRVAAISSSDDEN